MKYITVIADIKAKPNEVEFIKHQLCILVRPTLMEKGCINYGFYQDRNDKTFFHSVENWTDEISIKKHLASEHIKRYLNVTKDKVDLFEIKYFNRIC